MGIEKDSSFLSDYKIQSKMTFTPGFMDSEQEKNRNFFGS